MTLHEYLIDGEGRKWCAFDCPAGAQHWEGEWETEYEPAALESSTLTTYRITKDDADKITHYDAIDL